MPTNGHPLGSATQAKSMDVIELFTEFFVIIAIAGLLQFLRQNVACVSARALHLPYDDHVQRVMVPVQKVHRLQVF